MRTSPLSTLLVLGMSILLALLVVVPVLGFLHEAFSGMECQFAARTTAAAPSCPVSR